MIMEPQLFVPDTALLNKLAKDYSGNSASARARAHDFVARLAECGIAICFTLTHVLECLRHKHGPTRRSRLKLFQSLPHVAWVRPYDENWFPGDLVAILQRELHGMCHGGLLEWPALVKCVRDSMWQTGTGAEIFIDKSDLWENVELLSADSLDKDIYVASIARADVFGDVGKMRLKDFENRWVASYKDRQLSLVEGINQFAQRLTATGDKRLNAHWASTYFLSDIRQRIEKAVAAGEKPLDWLLREFGVEEDQISPETTIEAIGAIASQNEKMRRLARSLSPPVDLPIRDLAHLSLPSLCLNDRISDCQRKASRVTGSDLGDGRLAGLGLYADFVQVDKRTYEYLRQVQRKHRRLGKLMNTYVKQSDYESLLGGLADRNSH